MERRREPLLYFAKKGRVFRMDNKKIEALHMISELEEKHCKGCKIRAEIRERDGKPMDYCISACKIGKRIQSLGGLVTCGFLQNGNFKAADLTKDQYLEEYKSGLSDTEIAKKYGIHRVTLTRRKKNWGLSNKKIFAGARAVLGKYSEEEFRELMKGRTDYQAAKIAGVSKSAIHRQRAKYGIPPQKELLRQKYTKDEYLYLADKRGLENKEIVELWEISLTSLYLMLRVWGIPAKQRRLSKKREKQKKII